MGLLVLLAIGWLATAPVHAGPPPLRLISLAPSISATLVSLQATGSLIAVDEESRRLSSLGHLPSVGGLFAPDLERTVELRPTLVLAVRSGRQQPYLEALRQRGVRVVEMAPYTLDEVLQSFRHIGRLVGRWAEAEALVEREREQIAAVAERAPCAAAACPRVAIVLERDPLYVIGAGSFVHSLLEAAGARNAFEDLSDPYPRVSLEELVSRTPDLLLDASVAATDAADAAEAVRGFWGRFAGLEGVRPLLAPAITLPAPPLARAAELLLEAVHPAAAGP